MTVDERKDYIRAVKCMLNSPPKTKNYASGIQNRYEDFVAMHVNTTLGGSSPLTMCRIDKSSNPFPNHVGVDMNNFKGASRDPSGWAQGILNHGPHEIGPWHRFVFNFEEISLQLLILPSQGLSFNFGKTQFETNVAGRVGSLVGQIVAKSACNLHEPLTKADRLGLSPRYPRVRG